MLAHLNYFSSHTEAFSIKEEKGVGDCLLHLLSTLNTSRLVLLLPFYRSEN